jgi:hypothetical protein
MGPISANLQLSDCNVHFPWLTPNQTGRLAVSCNIIWLWFTVQGLQKRTHRLWYSWAILFPGDTTTKTCLSRLRETKIWESNLWCWAPQDSGQRMTAQVRPINDCNYRSLILSEGRLASKNLQLSDSLIYICSYAPDGYQKLRQTGRLTVGRNVTVTLT